MSVPNAPMGFAVDCPVPALSAGLTAHTLGPSLVFGSTWFNGNFWRQPIAGQSVPNADGSIYLPIGGNGYGICTAQQVNAVLGTWRGSAYRAPFYIEAAISFVPTPNPGAAHPSFWADDIEGMSTVNATVKADQWIGQAPGYLNSVEIDFFEQDAPDVTKYGHGLHHWYGPVGSGLQVRGLQPIVTITPSVFMQQNRFGFRILPATATTLGEARWYFNRVQVGTTQTWQLYNAALPPPPVLGSSAFAVADTRHYSPSINTCDGCPMTVHSVDMWQGSAANNLIH